MDHSLFKLCKYKDELIIFPPKPKASPILHNDTISHSFPGGSVVKNPPANAGDVGSIPGQEDPLEEEMATHSSTLAWEIPWTEEPGRLQSMGSQRVKHHLVTEQQQPAKLEI